MNEKIQERSRNNQELSVLSRKCVIVFEFFFIPVTGMKCSYGKIFIPGYQDLGCRNRDLGNRAGPPSHMNTSNILQRK